ncbi:hypothetical protein FN976_12310 [Caenimonas sedimenti]|uniref:Uncharacterized protein n=1 Tax=Caenimonas sedimenti TaxID=2596921 RepID=A0A562ZS21_9BURK|nr:hypothetical protein [Caenimonas sedimenti]TWO71095.1 hypothetical protein FN976_12310 [Caenimonas sedimenti]
MRIKHHPTHWLGVAAIVALALLAFEAAGQSTGAGAMFEGRPAMAGAQGGQGAQAGPPQGGIGLQGTEGAELRLRRPAIIEQSMNPPPAAACADLPRTSAAEQPLCLPQVRDERMERRVARLGIDAQQR